MSSSDEPKAQSFPGVLTEEREQAIRLEAISRFAAGIAHDFNNYLTAIIGYANLLVDSGRLDTAQQRDTDAILMAAQQAAGLTRQLLALSRKQFMVPRPVDPNELLRGLEARLLSAFGDDCRLALHLDPTVAQVRVDRGQMGQALLELATYCKSTMSAGGRISLTSSSASLARESHREGPSPNGLPGVFITVTADGPGLAREALLRIFEPFAAADGRSGKASLCLAMVHGIVQQSGGSIHAESQAGQGLSFHIKLPSVVEPAPERLPPAGATAAGRQSALVLLVEDEDLLRSMAARVLERAGFQVLTACNGVEALGVCARHPGQIRLIVTDVVMPQMGGLELAARIRAREPAAKVLFMSGFTEASIASAEQAGSAHFLQKPFMPEGLLSKVREVLGS